MEDEGGEGLGGAGDQFHRSEAISAVQDEDPYLGEEDEDYDDLYNDVNVGENFLQSLRRGDDAGGYSQHEAATEKAPEALPPPPSLPPQRHPQPQQQQAPPLPLLPAPQPPPSVFPERPTMIPGIGGDPPKMERGVDGGRGYPEMGYRGPNEPAAVRAPASGFGGPRPEMGQPPPVRPGPAPVQGQYGAANFPNDGFARQQGGAAVGGGGSGVVGAVAGGVGGGGGGGGAYNVNLNGGTGTGAAGGGGGGSGGTILFVGDLHWWTTDADLEVELCKYGQMKELKFFDERASGKSKGYCQVEFYDPMSATACKEGMNGHVFNGRPCVVAFASPNTVRRMGEAQVSKNQAMTQAQSAPSQPRGRGGGGGVNTGGGHGRGGGGGGGGGGGWGRGGGGMGGRGQVGGMRNRIGAAGGRGIMGNGGLVTPPPPPVLHPGAMLGQGFDPTGGYGAAMGRMAGGYAGFPAGPAAPPFPGMIPSFPPVVAPHVNPAFFGRGMPTGGVGMWSDPNAAGWGGEEQSSYGDDAVSDQQYGEVSHGKDRVSDRDWSGASDRRHRDDREKDMGTGHEWTERRHHDEREIGRERDRDRDRERDRERERERERERDRERERYREDRERHGDHHRHKEREMERDEEWDRGQMVWPFYFGGDFSLLGCYFQTFFTDGRRVSWSWRWERNGTFSVSSAYAIISDWGEGGRGLACDIQGHLGIQMHVCSLFGDEEEDLDHVFVACPYARGIWESIGQTLHLPMPQCEKLQFLFSEWQRSWAHKGDKGAWLRTPYQQDSGIYTHEKLIIGGA
ncbi:hypothetical protein Taro_039902 [Colocasia esculenta]|uniref:RRM domain-containing protein n=1 Tax=Colocasia esculenta TaxID=4460 RepID=A0A843WK86_COLES|nr:hypothetical protein [Colocasia esculenta]